MQSQVPHCHGRVRILQTLTVAFNHPEAQVDFGKKLLEICPDPPLMTTQEFVTTPFKTTWLPDFQDRESAWTQKIQCNPWNFTRITPCHRSAGGDAQHTARHNMVEYFVRQRRNPHSSTVTSHLKILRLGFWSCSPQLRGDTK